MNNKSRLENSKVNFFNGMFCFALTTLLTFIVRTLFIRFLDVSYLGINGLYSNILQLLTLSELGLNSIALYSLYKPVADNDQKRIASLVRYFSRLYNFISIIIFLLGISFCPFLKFIIDSDLQLFDLILYYILFVLNTSLSYLGTSNQLLINADQKIYIIKNTNLIFNILQNVLQIFILILFKNYYLYLIIQCLCTVLFNLTLYFIAKKNYPFLTSNDDYTIDTKTKTNIFTSLKSVFLYKVSIVLINSTDNIFISVLLGTSVVGYYSNYAMIVSVIVNFINIMLSSVSSSIGNLNSTTDNDKKVDIFYKFLFLMQWVVSIFSICIFVLISDVINIWIGEKYLLSELAVFAIVLNFYVSNIINPVWIYRETLGMFNEVKTLVVKTAIFNIIFTWLLGYFIGLPGIFFATVLSRLFTTVWKEPILLLRDKFNVSVKKYYLLQIKYFTLFICILLLSYWLFSFVVVTNFVLLIFKGFCLFAFLNILYLLLFFKSDGFIYYKDLFFNKILSK